MAVGNSLLACLSLLLGRYWQAALYKPGAFGDEFRALRLPSLWAAGLVLVTVAGALSGRSWQRGLPWQEYLSRFVVLRSCTMLRETDSLDLDFWL